MPSLQSRVLALDDDAKFLENLGFALRDSFELIPAHTVEVAMQKLAAYQVDAVILDYHLGLENGHSVLDQMRDFGHSQPVIVVSGVVNLGMTVGFLKRRVFGFLEKPVSLSELHSLLVEAISSTGSIDHAELGYSVDANTRQVMVNGVAVNLTPTEYEILSYFLRHRKRQVLREDLSAHLWGENKVSKNAFDTHLLNLKKKLPPFADRLISIYGVGYCYEV